jgi:hypothetical protein
MTNLPVTNKLGFGRRDLWKVGVVVFFGVIIIFRMSVAGGLDGKINQETTTEIAAIIPTEDVTLPIVWGDLGKQMIDAGVIDAGKFEMLYARRGELGEYERALLRGENNGALVINQKNSGVILNLFWALGLGNKNPILEEGPMTDPRYSENRQLASGFASTGGWTLSRGDSMNHYSKHAFVVLTPTQQTLVERVAKTIYRPCCDNATYFPDCNHGMAMLGLLELMASQGASEAEMYQVALQVNSFWFPDVYQTIAQFFTNQGISWADVDPKTVLGPEYSSASGYGRILTLVKPPEPTSGSGCSV